MQGVGGGQVPVLVEVSGRGRVGEQTMICLPRGEEEGEVVEPGHRDEREQERLEVRTEHRLVMKRQWKKLKAKSVLTVAQALSRDEEHS